MPSPASSLIKVAAIPNGCCIRVEGRGTMQESPLASDIAIRTLQSDPSAMVVYDLSACQYLDSTFLGGLVSLWQRFGGMADSGSECSRRYAVFASEQQRKKLFGACGIDPILPRLSQPPQIIGPWHVLPAASHDPRELMQHVMHCHRALAQVDCPMQATFAKIADAIEKDLAKA
ncbi:MAG TPA: hypothetical protein VNL70_05365 [Tepidisphaeraceae bacterium]|nr:hypothetical protein [Tepidisphaeraceae bacterium]